MQLPVWVWKCTPAAKLPTLHVIHPHHVYRGIGHVVRGTRVHLPTHVILATAITCAFVPLATALAPAALPAFVPAAAAPIYFAPEGLHDGASDIGSWKTEGVPIHAAQPAFFSGPKGALASDVLSPTNIGLPVARADLRPELRSQVVSLDLLASPFPAVTTPIPTMATPTPEVAIPVPGILSAVPKEIDEPGSVGLFALSLLWMAAIRLRKPPRKKDTSNAALNAMVFA